MNAKDYSNKRENLINQLYRLDIDIRERLLVLSLLYPDAPIAQKMELKQNSFQPNDVSNEVVDIKALSLNHSYVDSINIELCILYIQAIEKFVAAQHPHQQLNLF